MIHQPSGGAQGQATDIDIQREGNSDHQGASSTLDGAAHRPSSGTIERDTERDQFHEMPSRAKEYGSDDELCRQRMP